MAECLRFFRVLLPDFSTRMPLPVEIGEKLLSDGGSKASLINSTSGVAWQVDVLRDGRKAYFGGERWYDLTMSNDLRIGYFLVFRYRGSMFFTFRVFDLSTCEKLTSPPPTFQLEMLSVDDTDIDNQAIGMHPPEMVETGGRLGLIQEEHRFSTIMSPKNITQRHVHLHVPAKFRDGIGLSEDKCELTILDPTGRYWNIGCNHRSRLRTGYAYCETTCSRGWSKFARHNELRVGDECTFELVTKVDEDGLITIRMLPVVRMVATP